jgi:hypothetical protein
MMRIRYLVLAIASCVPAWSSAQPAATPTVRAAAKPHANPRLKLSYRRFAISHTDGSALWLDGAQVDAYYLSRRWVRLGVEGQGGGTRSQLLSTPANLAYGLFGLNAAVQYPWRVTPFLEGRFAAGFLNGKLDGPLTFGNLTLNADTSTTTWMYHGGLETGLEVYTVNRLYISAAVGWVRSTWRGPDVAAMMLAPQEGLKLKDITGDSFTFKVGFGI